MAILNFIIDNILINAAVILGLVALLGLILQKKPFADCLSGTFKTMMGFMVLSAGANVIVGALEPFSVWFAAGLGIDGAVASIEAVLAVAMQNEVVGRDIALVYAGIFVVNLILARFTKLKYVFLNGEAPIYIAMASILFGVGLCGFGHGLAIGQCIRDSFDLRGRQPRRVEGTEQLRPGQLKAGGFGPRYRINDIAAILADIEIPCHGIAGPEGIGVSLTYCRHLYGQRRLRKAVVLPCLRAQLPLCVQRGKRGEHRVAGRGVQMVSGIFSQRPAVGGIE